MKATPRLRLATGTNEPSGETILDVLGLDEASVAREQDRRRQEEFRDHRTALKAFLRAASALAKRPDLTSGPDLLAIRRGMAAIDAACAARSAANELDRMMLENVA